MTVHRIATTNVVGVFPSFTPASEALDALVEAGFAPEGELSLLGPDREMRPAVGHLVDANGEGASGTATGLAKGGAFGGAVGAAVTAVGAVAATAIPGVGLAVGPAALIGAIAGGGGGATVGSLLGLESAGRRTTMWQQTLSPLASRVSSEQVVLVAAHTDDEERAEIAREVLDARAAEVHVLTADVGYTPEERAASVGSPPPSTSADEPDGMSTVVGKDEHGAPSED